MVLGGGEVEGGVEAAKGVLDEAGVELEQHPSFICVVVVGGGDEALVEQPVSSP